MKPVGQLGKKDVAILALATALLLGNLAAIGATGRERAKTAVCKANLKQLGGAQALFLDDNDNRYPSPWLWLLKTEAPVAGYERYCRWHDPRYPPDGPLQAYLVKEKVVLCPVFAGLAEPFALRHPLHDRSAPIDAQYSYSMNAFLGTRNVTASGGVVTPAEITRSKAEVFVFAEENMWPRPGNASVLNDTALCADGRDWFGTFHGVSSEDLNFGTANAVFADGHAQEVRSGLVTTKDLMADRTDAEYGRFEKYAWPFNHPPP